MKVRSITNNQIALTLARNLLIDRDEIKYIDNTSTIEEVKKLFVLEEYILVCNQNLDDVVGYICRSSYLKDINVIPQALPVIFVTLNTELQTILSLMYKNNDKTPTANGNKQVKLQPEVLETLCKVVPIAGTPMVVVDSYGNTQGLITECSILRGIYLEHIKPSWTNNGQEIIIDAQTAVEELEQETSIKLENYSSAETVGGVIIEQLGRIPVKGERFQLGKYTLQIIEAESRRINTVSIQL